MTVQNIESPSLFHKLKSISLVSQILIAILLASLFATIAPQSAKTFAMLGSFFVSALKAVAPILVLVIVTSAVANQKIE